MVVREDLTGVGQHYPRTGADALRKASLDVDDTRIDGVGYLRPSSAGADWPFRIADPSRRRDRGIGLRERRADGARVRAVVLKGSGRSGR